MDRLGFVYFNGKLAGRLEEIESGYKFTYDSVYLEKGTPIGINFPFSQSAYYSVDLFPFFSNLLSEGWLLELQTTVQHLDPTDEFGLLLRNGQDLAGAVTVTEVLL